MKQVVFLCSAWICLAFLGGCASGVVALSDEESLKYEKAYLNAMEDLSEPVKERKMMQPNNKKEACKILVEIDGEDKTLQTDYQLYWDGQCRDGFAFGLGREIERTHVSHLEQIAVYKNGIAEDYCVFYDKSRGDEFKKFEGFCGESGERAGVATSISEKLGELDVKIAVITYSWNQKEPNFITTASPFYDTSYIKEYSNFSYRFTEYPSLYDSLAFSFETLNKEKKLNGISSYLSKEKVVFSGEYQDGKLIRKVSLPKSYGEYMGLIYNEIKEATQKSLQFQEEALRLKESYKRKICNKNVKISFMDKESYGEICKEQEREEKLNVKINAKVAKINAEKEKKWLQAQKQKELEMMRRMTEAQEDINTQRALNNLNLQMQQTNRILQGYHFNMGQQRLQNFR